MATQMEHSTVSVILPVFNSARWLPKALASLRAQRHVSLEIVAIDDGSTDESGSILENANFAPHKVRRIRNARNLGIVASLNKGLDVATGAYIARMDADDVSLPNRFVRQLEFLKDSGCDLCGSWFTEFGGGPARTVRWPYRESAVKAAMLFQNSICHPTIMAKRRVFDSLRYRENYTLAEDYDFFGRASTEFRVANVPAPLTRYRRHPEQATRAKRQAMELITRRIRSEMLRRHGFDPSPDEDRLHNAIRAPASIHDADDLKGIETWLLKLYAAHDDADAQHVIASQWVRACVRAAPLGRKMWRAFLASPLVDLAGQGMTVKIDMLLLASLGIEYNSPRFDALRRFGLST